MMLNLRILPVLVMLVLPLAGSWAQQCPTTDSYVTSTTVASCPSNGVMQFTNPADVPVTGGSGVSGAIYTITSGPSSGGYQTSGQSANRFEGLPPGTYTVTITKPDCPSVVKSNVVVGTTYTPVSLSVGVGSNTCVNGQPSITISTTATGGNAPLTYAYVLSTDPSIDDNSLTYSPSSSTVVATAGTYQVRAKDACGTFVTRSITVGFASPKAFFNPVASNKDCNNYTFNGVLTPSAGGSAITPTAAAPYKIELFDVSSTNPCAVPTGASSFTTINATSTSDLKFDLAKTHPRIVVRTTSPCGEVETRCYDFVSSLGPIINTPVLAPSCQQVNGASGEKILFTTSRVTNPVSITISSRASGNPVLTTTATTSSSSFTYTVPYVAEGYVIRLQNACGQVISSTVTNPPSGTAAVTTNVSSDRSCADQIGNKRTILNLSGGDTGVLDAGSKVELTNGPAGAISPARQSDGSSNNTFYFYNLAPGTYTGQIVTTTTGCGPKSFTFAVPANSTGSPGLTYSLTGSVTQLCGGLDNLTTSFNYNGPGSVTYVLTNPNSTTTSNTSGSFTNLQPGVYTVRASASTGCNYNFTQTQSFTLTAADTQLSISKSIGVVCENNGTPTSTGQAYFQFTGLTPYRFERQPVGSSTWTTVGSGITTSTYAVTGLSANSSYNFRLTDACGKSVVITVSIKPLDAQQVENKLQPCSNQDYTLSAPDLAGATYSWTKDGGSAFSTNRQIVFAPYKDSDDGLYVSTITLGNNCVVRQARVMLNHTNCNQPLPVNLVSFKATPIGNTSVDVSWVTAREVDNAYFLIQRSKDLATFETLTRVQPSEKGLSGSSYQYIDAAPYAGTSYYRLQQVDISGKATTYPAVSVVLRKDAYGVYPNPVTESQFTLNLDEPQFAKVGLYSAEGRAINIKRTVLGPNALSLQATDNLAAGVYLLLVEERGHQKTYRLLIKK